MTRTPRLTRIAAITLATAVWHAPAVADESKRTQLGVLDCTVEGGLGLLVGSSKDATCQFTHEDGTVELYTGSLSKLGLDVGISGESYLKWIVFTPVGNEVGQYALQGDYVGLSAGVALGIGLDAKALVGGSNDKIGLQPLSVEGKTGLNLAVGFSSLSLQPAG